jgi:hypothetical protein
VKRFDGMKRRVLIAAAVSGFVASATLGGSGTASASADAAPPGYSGPFLGECKGHWVKTVPVPDGMGEIKIWYDPAGSGTYCAKTYDNRAGDHNMEVRLRHQEWAASGTTQASTLLMPGASTSLKPMTGAPLSAGG